MEHIPGVIAPGFGIDHVAEFRQGGRCDSVPEVLRSETQEDPLLRPSLRADF